MNLSPTQIDALVTRFGATNEQKFRDLTPQTGWLLPTTMGELITANPEVAFTGLVEIFRRQTGDERGNGGTCHKNKFGFSKKHVTRGSELALKYLSGAELDFMDVKDAVRIALSYREQLWMVRLGAVPVNNLTLRPIKQVETEELPAPEVSVTEETIEADPEILNDLDTLRIALERSPENDNAQV